MYNKEICRRVAGAKNINTLLDAFKSTQMILLKVKKYEGLVSDDEHGHTVHAVNQITSKGSDMTTQDKSLTQTDGYGQRYVSLTNRYPKQVSNQQQQNTNVWKSLPTAPTTLHSLLHIWCIQVFK